MPAYQPQQVEEDGHEAWATHHASQSPNQVTQGQVNGLLVTVFCASFLLNFTISGSAPAYSQRVEGYLVAFVLSGMALVWVVLLVKIRECLVWPERLTFHRDGLLVLELGCGYRVLDAQEGVVLMRKRVTACNTNLGVWCNALTDKNRDSVFVLAPSEGPRFWRGFAFQPEDEGAFLHDCRHAGVHFLDGEATSGLALEEDGLEDGRAGGLLLGQALDSSRDRPPVPLLDWDAARPRRWTRHIADLERDSDVETDDAAQAESESDGDEDDEGDESASDDATAKEDFELTLQKNNNIVEV